MAMFDTKYPNNSRVVSGTPQLYNDDVILLCDTSAGPVTINLLEIPANKWNTTWKLYVIDNSSNASVNNITIVAGGTQLVNAQATLVLNTNDSGAMIRIMSDTAFLGNLLFVAGGGGTDELVKVTGADTTAGFLQAKAVAGAGITMTTLFPGGNENLEISSIAGSVVSITGANMTTLINTTSVVVGQIYLITDATYTQGGVYVRGLSTSTISREGRGIFLNVDYQNVNGNFAGTWRDTIVGLVAGVSMVGWTGEVYQSVTGVNTATTPDADAVNWLLLPRSTSPAVYITEIDFVIYNETANEITMREDRRKNIVEQVLSIKPPFATLEYNWFKWGDDRVTYNKAINGGWIRNTNWEYNEPAGFGGNVCDNYGYIDALNSNNRCQYNYVTNGGWIDVMNFSVLLVRYNFLNGGRISGANATGGGVQLNTIEQNSQIYAVNLVGGNIDQNYIGPGGCTIDVTDFETGDVKWNRICGDVAGAAFGYAGASIDMKNGTMCDVKYNTIDSGIILLTDVIGTPGVRATMHYNQVSGNSIIDGRNMGKAQVQYNVLDNSSNLDVNLSVGTLTKNIILNSSTIDAGNSVLDSDISENILENQCTLTATTLTGTIRKNSLKNNSNLIVTTSTPAGLTEENVLENSSTLNAPFIGGVIRRNTITNVSTIEAQVSPNIFTISDNIVDTTSMLSCNNAKASSSILNNTLTNVSTISADQNNGIIQLNTLADSSIITATTNGGTIQSNSLSNAGEINCANATASHFIMRNKITINSQINSDANAGSIVNNVIENSSSINSANNGATGTIQNNIVIQNSTINSSTNSSIIGQWSDAQKGNYLNDGTLTVQTNSAHVGGNYITQQSIIDITTNTNSVYANILGQNGFINITTNNAPLGFNTLHRGVINITTSSADVLNQSKYMGISTWELEIDMNDVSFFAGTKLTISNFYTYGIFKLTNCNGKTFNQLQGGSDDHDQTFINSDTVGSFTLNTGTIAGAGGDSTLLLHNAPVIAGALVAGHLNTGNGDWFKTRRLFSTSNPVVTEINIFP